MPTPKSKRTYVLQSSNHDSEFDSLRDAVADLQDESAQSDGADTLTGESYSEASPYNTISTGDGNDGFRSTLRIINTGNGADFLTEFSGVSSVEATLLILPSLQKVREAARSSGSSSSDGAWALGSTFELTSGVPFSSQTETSGGPRVRQFPGGRQHSVSALA